MSRGPSTSTISIASLALTALLGSACSSGRSAPEPAEAKKPAAQPVAQAQQAAPRMIPESAFRHALDGRVAPSRELKLLNGGTTSVESFRDQVLVLTFWASWCGPCRKEMPELDELHAEMKDRGLAVLGVNVDTNPARAHGFLRSRPVGFPIAVDPESLLLGEYGVGNMPTSFVIDRKGIVRQTTVGFRQSDMPKLRRLVNTLLAETS